MNVLNEDTTPKQKKYAGFVSIKNWLAFGFGVKSSRKMHIHHIDQNPSNNDIRNLVLVSSAEHRHIHKESRWDSDWKKHRYFKNKLARLRMFPLLMARSIIQITHNGLKVCDRCGKPIIKTQRLQSVCTLQYPDKKFHTQCWDEIVHRNDETTGEVAELKAHMQAVWDRREMRYQARMAAKNTA